MSRALIAWGVALAACNGNRSEPVPVPSAPPAVALPHVARERDDLTMTAKGSAFALVDKAGVVQVTLPSKPQVSGQMAAQGGVEVYNAQAVMPGSPVDVQFGVATVMDGDLPPELLASLDEIPAQLATASGGTLAKNALGTLAGRPARVFELQTSDHRRLFGWYVAVSPRMVQLNCVGAEGSAARDACAAIAQSVVLK